MASEESGVVGTFSVAAVAFLVVLTFIGKFCLFCLISWVLGVGFCGIVCFDMVGNIRLGFSEFSRGF